MTSRKLARRLRLSLITLRTYPVFRNIETCCLFLGHPRSGSTLAGALLNAHRHAVISHELDFVDHLRRDRHRATTFLRILERDAWFRDLAWQWTGYDYSIPNQWQGRFERLKVIGDKNSHRTTRLLGRKPELLDLIRKTVRCRVKFVCVTRNPFDNITTMYPKRESRRSFEQTIDEYFHNCATNQELRRLIPKQDLLFYQHEQMLAEPRVILPRVCEFLGLDCPEDYLRDCAGVLFTSPRKTREKIEWPDWAIQRVEEQIPRYDFLAGYSYVS